MLMVMCQPPLRNVGSPLGRMSSVFVILWSRLTQRPKEWWQQRGGSGEGAQMGHTHKMRGLDCGEHWPHWAIRDAVALACCKWPVWRYFCQDKIKVIKYSYLHATHKRNATNSRDVHRMHGSRLKCFVISARTWLNVWGKGGGYSGQLRSMGFIWAGWGTRRHPCIIYEAPEAAAAAATSGQVDCCNISLPVPPMYHLNLLLCHPLGQLPSCSSFHRSIADF